MSHFDHRQFDAALGGMDATILASLPLALDGLLDSAALARPGHDAEAYADSLRATARQMHALTALLGAMPRG
ncbi:MAG: hypothetical protein KF780_07960 [Sphingomonas sp.]|nr:hypothetical protein [Sphingomonas sp.]